MMQSVMQKVGPVDFPAFMAERIYMREFRLETGLPEDLKRWQPTVDQMLVGVDTDGPIYLMVDQKFIVAAETHRRPGLHVDGYWIPGNNAWNDDPPTPWNAVSEELRQRISAHGDRGGSHDAGSQRNNTHGPRSGHGGVSEEEERRRQDEARRQREADLGKPHKTPRKNYDTRRPTKNAGGRYGVPGNGPGWVFDEQDRPEAIILASDLSASRALLGEWEGFICPGGDVSHLDLSHMQSVILDAHTAYAGNVTFVHESLPVLQDCYRTVVRLNVPNHHIH